MSAESLEAKEHAQIIRHKLGHLYHLQPSFEALYTHPELYLNAYYGYKDLTQRSLTFDSRELHIIETVSNNLHDTPHKSAFTLYTQILPHVALFGDAIQSLSDPSTDNYRIGISQLADMMTAAWDMKLDGLVPRDGDRRSDGVIWGHVKGATDPLLNIHFWAAHQVERIITAGLQDSALHHVVQHKDWLLNFITARVCLDHLQQTGFGSSVYEIWRQPRPQGLGWIDDLRHIAYEQATV